MERPGRQPPNGIDISVILPVYNEAECIEAVVRELFEHLSRLRAHRVEVLAVDDGSSDGTAAALARLRIAYDNLRVIRLTPNAGQSAALGAGFRHARGHFIVTLDADGQIDPADIPAFVEALAGCDCVFGYRERRQDTFSKRWGSRWANCIRNAVLGENIIDTGCPLKAFRAEFVREIPMWKGMHRFLASFCCMKGAEIRQMPVRHRTRLAGQSKYSNWGRLTRTIADLLAVRWMKKRSTRFEEKEVL